MSTMTTKGGTEIYYKAWGTGQPDVLSHGWPLSSDAWEAQMLFLASKCYRAIGHDRRGACDGKNRHARDPEGLSGQRARIGRHESGPAQRGPARFPQVLAERRVVLPSHGHWNQENTDEQPQA